MGKVRYRCFWTIWSFGWWRVKSYQGKTIELKIFIGPLIVTLW